MAHRGKLVCTEGNLEDCYIPLEDVIAYAKENPNPNMSRQQRRQKIRELEAKLQKIKKRGLR